jgi:hypothetical protein
MEQLYLSMRPVNSKSNRHAATDAPMANKKSHFDVICHREQAMDVCV